MKVWEYYGINGNETKDIFESWHEKLNLHLQAELSYIPFKLPQMTLTVLSLSPLHPWPPTH